MDFFKKTPDFLRVFNYLFLSLRAMNKLNSLVAHNFLLKKEILMKNVFPQTIRVALNGRVLRAKCCFSDSSTN